MTHWAFRRLAAQFAKAGFPALRFDYSGTGDSSGSAHEASPEGWAQDVTAAAAELKDLTGVRKIVLLGMRFGAAIASRAVAAGLKVSHLVLWEPVTQGSRYPEQLEELDDREALRLLHRVSQPRVELGGYPMTSAQRAAITALGAGIGSAQGPRSASQCSCRGPGARRARAHSGVDAGGPQAHAHRRSGHRVRDREQ